MISLILKTPNEMMLHLAKKAKQKRLFLNYSQASLSSRSGVSLAVIKKFERTGKISLESLLKLAFCLNCLEEFDQLFHEINSEKLITLDDLLKKNDRKRGRQ